MMALGQRLFERLQNLGLRGDQSQQDQKQILILNTFNLLAILPLNVLLGCAYALEGLWPGSLLMGLSFGLLVAFMAGHSHGKIGLIAYRQYSLFISFACPFILTFLLGGYHNSGLVMLWSLRTPMLAILLGRTQTARNWLGFFISLNLLVIAVFHAHHSSSETGFDYNGLFAFNGIGVGILIYSCLLHLQRQHQQAIEQLDQFASLVAHELRNPLTSISLGITHGLRQRERLSPNQFEALETARAEAERIEAILQDLLQISRPPAGHPDLIRQRLDPYPLVWNLAAQAQAQFGIVVAIDCPLGEAERLLWAAPNMVAQMVWNLLENSAKYSDPHQPIAIAIRADRDAGQIQIEVSDRGATFSSQDCLAMLQPFTRLANASDNPGSGLGLTLVRRLASGMGGAISATPRPGGGLVVSLVLPRATPSERLQWGRSKRERERCL
jgi:signal transduction histidine kinase